MKQAGALLVAVVLVSWLVWNLWNVFRIATDFRGGSWRRPLWWARVGSIALFAGLMTWIWGKFRGGLDARKTCQFVHHEYYDRAYRDAHAVEFDRLFPLHNKCNAHFDLVPAWVNPSIMLCAALVLAAVAVPLRFGIACLTSFSRKEYQS
ncbi:hypothetical protein [Streptomyces sudanensis]|uniref:hypothetical protein n=1 Tax=Streptomyces sudanensis TaxID=436397 RepID=UPI0020CD67F8|nr:hypothetical protein [Streptomyces sudanensis]MCP9956614.1 hypothetical protein [Streptomyces sudanensis]MCQ0002782.1 hypothetical protein [Streptomyces sudanensis]